MSSSAHAFGLAGASPKYSATCAWTCGVAIQAIHLYMQFGCLAFDASIQVSAQPVIPSVGTTASTVDARALEGVGLVRPGRSDDDVAAREVVDLVGVAAQYLPMKAVLCLQQVDRGVELRLGQLVGIGDPEIRLVGLQVQGRVGEVDRAAVGRDLALVRLHLAGSKMTSQLVGAGFTRSVRHIRVLPPQPCETP